jgi:hypothetical protein
MLPHLTDRFHNRLYQNVLRIKEHHRIAGNADQQGSARHYLLLAEDFGMARRGLSKNGTFYADRIVIASSRHAHEGESHPWMVSSGSHPDGPPSHPGVSLQHMLQRNRHSRCVRARRETVVV